MMASSLSRRVDLLERHSAGRGGVRYVFAFRGVEPDPIRDAIEDCEMTTNEWLAWARERAGLESAR